MGHAVCVHATCARSFTAADSDLLLYTAFHWLAFLPYGPIPLVSNSSDFVCMQSSRSLDGGSSALVIGLF